ncbi:FAD-binding protein [Streptomyces sp. NPDC002845]
MSGYCAPAQHSLAVPTGTVSTTGVAGLPLGGGIGHLMRRYGATVDNLPACEMVYVDGRRVRADEAENPELFWATPRGGGASMSFVKRGVGSGFVEGAVGERREERADAVAGEAEEGLCVGLPAGSA